MSKYYNSNYKKFIKEFLELRVQLGYKITRDTYYLKDIDRCAIASNEIDEGFTKKFAETYSKIRLNESLNSRYIRVSLLARLSSFMTDLGIESYKPNLPRFQKSNFIPYIFSHEEIERLFQACDDLRMSINHHDSTLFSMPLILRILYATGIRISEAKSLTNNDINLIDSYIKVKDSKNGKERIIPVDESLIILCKEFLHQKSFLPFPIDGTDSFFINQSGKKCGASINTWFKKCLEIAKIKSNDNKKQARIHDLRHTFAVTSLAQMAKSGVDLYASLPILSTYLGHQSISATNHYVRLTASIFPELIRDLDSFYQDVFPKLTKYETN